MTRLVRYAGYDPEDDEFDQRWRQFVGLRALRMFRLQKMDTTEIARRFHAKEATVERWLASERDREYAERHA